jgi:hypothetical protein
LKVVHIPTWVITKESSEVVVEDLVVVEEGTEAVEVAET